MNIAAPFGYPEISPLNKNQHIVLSYPGIAPDFCRKLNILPISFSEYARVAHDYPIAYVSNNEGKTFIAVALLGLRAGENLFADKDGNWDASTYMPAYARRYPFCMAKVRVGDELRNEHIVCVALQAVDAANGERLFDDQGGALPRWVEMEKLLNEYDADLIRSEELCGMLKEYDLLEPFSIQASLNTDEPMQLTGMYRVTEARLEALEAEQLRTLIKKGVMGRIYTHLLSLENFSRLLGRKLGTQPAKT